MRRELKTAVLAAMAIALISSTAAQAQTTLSMWSRPGEALPALVEAFNAGHETQVDLQLVPAEQMVQKYATSVAGGSAPDLIGLDLIYTPAFAATGQLEDITAFAQGLSYFDELSKAHVEAGSYDGKIYGLPLLAEGSVLIWNKDLFKQAGLDPEKAPATWAEFEAAAAAVDALGGDINGFYFAGACGGCNAFTFMPLVWASGGEIFAEGGAKVTLDTPQMHDAVNFFRDMIGKGYVPESAETDNGATWLSTFASGKIGISQSGAFAIGSLNNDYPELDYGVGFLPGKDGGQSSFGGGDNFAISAGSGDKLDAITEFVDFLYSVEGQTIMAGYGSLPTRTDVAAEALKDQDPRYAIVAEAMSMGRTPSSPVYNDLINSPTGPWAQMLTEAFFGDDPDGAIAYAQETMQGIVDGFGQ